LQNRYIGITGCGLDPDPGVALVLAGSQHPVATPSYASAMAFTKDELDLIDRARTLRIETARPDGPIHTTIIWAVVDGGDIFIRSWRGAGARWYREAVANPDVALHVGKRRLPARAEAATDPDSVRRTSLGLERKYAGDPATPSMVREEILDTTLRLEARGE
jgi:hypothetical protein